MAGLHKAWTFPPSNTEQRSLAPTAEKCVDRAWVRFLVVVLATPTPLCRQEYISIAYHVSMLFICRNLRNEDLADADVGDIKACLLHLSNDGQAVLEMWVCIESTMPWLSAQCSTLASDDLFRAT